MPYFADQDPFAAELTDETWIGLTFAPEVLVDYLDIVLANGHLSDPTKAKIVDSMKRDDLLDPLSSAFYAAYLVMISPDYVVKK